MPWEVLHFFVNLVEVIAAVTGVLAAGLLITLTGLWILPKIFSVKAETLEDSELDEEGENSHQQEALRDQHSLDTR